MRNHISGLESRVTTVSHKLVFRMALLMRNVKFTLRDDRKCPLTPVNLRQEGRKLSPKRINENSCTILDMFPRTQRRIAPNTNQFAYSTLENVELLR